MKTTATVLALFFGLNGLFAQGYVAFNNFSSNTEQRVRLYSDIGPYAGAEYSVGLYWAPDGTTDESMFVLLGRPTSPIVLDTGVTTGLYGGGNRTVPITSGGPGGYAMLQVRGWTTAYGQSYEEAI